MFAITHANADNTYSITDLDTNEVIDHITKEVLESKLVPVLGVFRNLDMTIESIHSIQSQETSQELSNFIDSKDTNTFEYLYIKDPTIRAFAHACLRWIPSYFFTTAASSSGKYHPSSNLSYKGLLRHTIFVCKNLYNITYIESSKQLFSFTQREIDLMMVACLLHDSLKDGWNYDVKNSYSQHPNNAAKAVRGMIGFGLEYIDLDFIAHCIESHMGQWNTDKQGNVILPKPGDKYQWLVHLCDYLASRPDISLTYNNTVYAKDGNKPELVSFGKTDISSSTPALDGTTVKLRAKQQVSLSGVTTEKTGLSQEDINAINNFLQRTGDISQAKLEEFGIVGDKVKIFSVLQSILKYNNVTPNQEKYLKLAKSYR